MVMIHRGKINNTREGTEEVGEGGITVGPHARICLFSIPIFLNRRAHTANCA